MKKWIALLLAALMLSACCAMAESPTIIYPPVDTDVEGVAIIVVDPQTEPVQKLTEELAASFQDTLSDDAKAALGEGEWNVDEILEIAVTGDPTGVDSLKATFETPTDFEGKTVGAVLYLLNGENKVVSVLPVSLQDGTHPVVTFAGQDLTAIQGAQTAALVLVSHE